METPSQEIVKAANATVTVTDTGGRSITLKKMNALDKMRLYEVVGPENVKNAYYFGTSMVVYHVVAVDGVDRPRPATKPQLEVLVQLLGDEGIKAVSKGVEENFITAALSDDETKEVIKNV